MDKCPYCGAETRPGDNFCLNCGNRLPSASPSSPTVVGDATMPAENDWVPPTQVEAASNGHDAVTERAEQPALPAIENPAHLVLRTESGEVLQEYVLDKYKFSIGRAPSSDILLSKDKLTSRNHATILYENAEYVLVDERSANGTFVNGQQLEEKVPYKLREGDHVLIGEYELIFHTSDAEIESMPTVMVSSGAQTYATNQDSQVTSSTNDDFGTRPWEDEKNKQNASPVPASVAVKEAEQPAPVAPSPAKIAETPLPVPVAAAPSSLEAGGVTFGRLTSLPQPQLPDVAPLMAALATLDGQVSSLQEQLNATQESMRNHDADIASTTNQLRQGVRHVSERMDNT
ncbi:MAG TPA: FHA domain-containing protein, partial [Ktedonobacteraceae bacterium]|nr:FHA domain-containing protein [Ktedonobacteraceae bacterium]